MPPRCRNWGLNSGRGGLSVRVRGGCDRKRVKARQRLKGRADGGGRSRLEGWTVLLARAGRKETLLLTPFFLRPHSWPLTHQRQLGSGGTPSGRLLGANAAPRSPQRPSHWAPPRSRAAAGPAEGPSPGRPPQPAGRVDGAQAMPGPELPTAPHAGPAALTHVAESAPAPPPSHC